ncbi:MAG: hypothetical protein JWO27_1807 [Frankiales bacterium]|jgi:hypothetical protein|nr:hypothetical protein [Frankiales bacterium]MCW2706185.1 hypothetical protein [Frankiales bacterium]
MAITTDKVSRAAGLCAIAAGLLYVLVQYIHPHETLANVTTTTWKVTHVLTVTMAVLALAGISGMYARQVRQAGVLGLVGYLLYAGCFLAILAFSFVEAFVLPAIAGQSTQFVSDVLALSTGGTRDGSVGGLDVVFQVGGVLYLLGGFVFGIALFRAGVLARWAGMLLSVGALITLTVPLLPHAQARLLALPVGLALAGLGRSLWRTPAPVTAIAPALAQPRLAPAGAA